MNIEGRLHILVIDDDLDMCIALDHLLKNFDHTLLAYRIVTNPYDALLEMADKEYDLLLLDMNIPEISGPEILKTMDQFITQDNVIKNSDLYRQKVPVILMSSSPTLLGKEIFLNHFQIQKKILKHNLKNYLSSRLSQGSINHENSKAH